MNMPPENILVGNGYFPKHPEIAAGLLGGENHTHFISISEAIGRRVRCGLPDDSTSILKTGDFLSQEQASMLACRGVTALPREILYTELPVMLEIPKDFQQIVSQTEKLVDSVMMSFAPEVENIRNAAEDTIKETLNRLEQSQQINMKSSHLRTEVHRHAKAMADYLREEENTPALIGFHGLAEHHMETSTHQGEVMFLATMISMVMREKFTAAELGFTLDDNAISEFGTGGGLHDVGKMAIPLDIITFEGKYSPEQFDLMKMHTLFGSKFLSNNEREWNNSALYAGTHHHVWWGESNREYGILTKYSKFIDTPLRLDVKTRTGSDIITVCDIFSGLREVRPYNNGGRTVFEALLMMVDMCRNGEIAALPFKVLYDAYMKGKFYSEKFFRAEDSLRLPSSMVEKISGLNPNNWYSVVAIEDGIGSKGKFKVLDDEMYVLNSDREAPKKLLPAENRVVDEVGVIELDFAEVVEFPMDQYNRQKILQPNFLPTF